MKDSIALNLNGAQVQEVSKLKNKSFSQLLEEIAIEYGSPVHNEWVVHSNAIDTSDKKLILSHILDSEDYEWSCSSPLRTELMFKENIEYIENAISEACDQVYFDYQEEMGMICDRHYDNGEYYFYKR